MGVEQRRQGNVHEQLGRADGYGGWGFDAVQGRTQDRGQWRKRRGRKGPSESDGPGGR